jgi:hypothetical protein
MVYGDMVDADKQKPGRRDLAVVCAALRFSGFRLGFRLGFSLVQDAQTLPSYALPLRFLAGCLGCAIACNTSPAASAAPPLSSVSGSIEAVELVRMRPSDVDCMQRNFLLTKVPKR